MISSVIGFLIILAPLVIVHEFGHFIFAKLFNVKAEVFSVGFGPRIWGRRFGETDFRLSIFPLGGYVKLVGEDREAPLSDEERKRSLYAQAAWKRFFIFFGGPLFNFLYAILVFMAMMVVGEPQTANVVARVLPQTAVEKAGFKSGDRILSINEKPTARFEDIMGVIHENPNKPLVFAVERGAQKIKLEATPSSQSGFTQYGEQTSVGELEGFMPMARALTIGVSNPKSKAGEAGFVTGDKIVSLNGTTLKDWEQFEVLYSGLAANSPVTLGIERSENKQKVEFAFNTGPKAPSSVKEFSDLTGIYSSELFVEKVVADSPAEKAGLKVKDRLLSVNGTVVESFFQLKELVQNGGESKGKVQLQWERNGKVHDAEMVPKGTLTRDALLNKVTQFTIGVMPLLVMTEPEVIIERTLNPFTLLYKGTERMIVFSWRNFVSIGKMFTGDVSVATLGGPIMIGKIAGESLTRGLHAFLMTMAILSIGLGVLNILPVPVLDGGHLVLLGLEVIRGKPLSLRQMEVIQQVGLSLILLLMIIVIRNDLSRVFTFQ